MDKRTEQAGGGRWWPLRDRAGFHLGERVRLWGGLVGGGGREDSEEWISGESLFRLCFVEQSCEPSWEQGWEERPSTL